MRKPTLYINHGYLTWRYSGVLDYRGDSHRIGAPATIGQDGTLIWCMYGVMHRMKGPAAVEPDYSLNLKAYWWIDGRFRWKKENRSYFLPAKE